MSTEGKNQKDAVAAVDFDRWRASFAERMDEFEAQLDLNTTSTQRVEANTKELVDILTSWKGAMQVFEFIGKVAKPVGAIATAVAAVWYLFWPRK